MNYAGIGSRKTPEAILTDMCQAAENLAEMGLILRSGGAYGADLAFETGCDRGKGTKEIYLPWKGHNGHDSGFYQLDQEAFEIAEKYHPNWGACSKAAKCLLARNSHQILGVGLDDPVSFVLCWTPEGKGQGGTGQAIRIAKAYDVPVIDLGELSIQQAESILGEIL